MFKTNALPLNQMEQHNSVKKLIYSMDLNFAEMSFSRFSTMRANEMLTDNYITSRDGQRYRTPPLFIHFLLNLINRLID